MEHTANMTPDECRIGCFSGDEKAIRYAAANGGTLPFTWAVFRAVNNEVRSDELLRASNEWLESDKRLPFIGCRLSKLAEMYIDFYEHGIKHEPEWVCY